MDGKGSEKKYDITMDVLVRPSPIDAMDSERIGISIGVDDGRWTNTVRPLAVLAIGLVVGLVVASSSSLLVLIDLDGQKSITRTSNL